MHLNGLKLRGAFEEFSISSLFVGSKCKNQLFEETKRLFAVFIKLKNIKYLNVS